jgi:hypothetical protein
MSRPSSCNLHGRCSHHKLPGHVNVKHKLAQRAGAAAGAGAGWGAEWLDPAGRKGGGGAGAEVAALPPAVPGDHAAEISAAEIFAQVR